MATPNVGILTNAGKNLIDRVNAGQTKITFSKIVFSSMNNNQLTDDQIKALTAVAPQEIVVNNPEVTLDNNTGETRIRATGNNRALSDGVYVKTYAVYAKDGSSNEILYGITVSPNPNYLPEYDGVTPQAVTYSYKVNISNTSKISFTNSNDVYVSDTDLAEAVKPYAKTVDVNQQLDKKVNVADMRKPASDVAGIEEVSAKQDKIAYTPADDSKVVHDNHDGTITASGTVFNLLNSLSASSIPQDPTKDYNTLPQGLALMSEVGGEPANMPPVKSTYLTLTIASSFANGRKRQLAWLDAGATSPNNNYTYIRYYVWGTWSSWDSIPTSSQISSLLPSDIARTGQANTFSLPQTFSQGVKTLQTGSYDDANSLVNEGLYYNTNPSIKNAAGSLTTGYIQVMSGGGEIVRQIMYSDTDGGVIYNRTSQNGGSSWSNWTQIVTWDQIPSDFVQTDTPQTFTAQQTFSIAPTITDASQDKGDNQAATMADLKSVEKSAWRVMTGSSDFFASFTCLYKINPAKQRIELIAFGRMTSKTKGAIINLSSIISGIKSLDGTFAFIDTDYNIHDVSVHFSGTQIIEDDLVAQEGMGGLLSHRGLNDDNVDNNPYYVYYTGLA